MLGRRESASVSSAAVIRRPPRWPVTRVAVMSRGRSPSPAVENGRSGAKAGRFGGLALPSSTRTAARCTMAG